MGVKTHSHTPSEKYRTGPGVKPMIDAAFWQAIAAVRGLLLAQSTLLGVWGFWLHRDLCRRIDRNHQDILTLLEGHVHGDGPAPVFHRLPTGAGN